MKPLIASPLASAGAERRLCAWLLIAGALVFFTGAFVPPMPMAWLQPTFATHLAFVAAHPTGWLVHLTLMGLGVPLTLLGFVIFGQVLRRGGACALTELGTTGLLLANAAWIGTVTLRLMVIPVAAAELHPNGNVASVWIAFHRWDGALLAIYMEFAYLSLAALGAAAVRRAAVGRVAGIVTCVSGVVGALLYPTGLSAPPFLQHIMPFVLGVAMLRASRS